MSHRRYVCVLVGLLAAIPAARAGELYTIRVKTTSAGESICVEKEETRTTRTIVHDALGRKVLDRQDKEVETLSYRETVLKVAADGQPSEFRRHYDKAQLKSGKTDRNYGYHGLTVVFCRERDKVQFAYDGGKPVGEEDAARLDREFNGGDERFRLSHLLPGKPVPVGADWRIDMAPLVKDFARTGRFAVDATWATGNGHLNKTTPAGGAQFGQLFYRMELPIRAQAISTPNRMPVLSGSKATFELTLDMCIDGSRPDATILGTAEVKTSADVAQPGGLPGRLTFLHRSESREVRKAAGDR